MADDENYELEDDLNGFEPDSEDEWLDEEE